MRSNKVARIAGVTVRTLRHYHALGLLPEPPRSANGYRDYAPADLARVLRIKRLASLGFPLTCIGEVMAQVDAGASADGPATDPLAELDRELEQEIARLEEQRRVIASLRRPLGGGARHPRHRRARLRRRRRGRAQARGRGA